MRRNTISKLETKANELFATVNRAIDANDYSLFAVRIIRLSSLFRDMSSRIATFLGRRRGDRKRFGLP